MKPDSFLDEISVNLAAWAGDVRSEPESFLEDPAHRRQHALSKIEALLPELQALVKTVTEQPPLTVAK